VCENNLYGFSTHYSRVTNIDNIADRAAAYGLIGVVADGMDVNDVYTKAGKCIEGARMKKGPALLECKTYRYRGHSRFEPAIYRAKEEVEEWKARDPITSWRNRLIGEMNVEELQLTEIEEDAQKVIEDSVAFAEASSGPSPSAYKNYVYKEQGEA
jgi:TPP-dependent pyruvate/acetoin dehydrogenase alpha subunit